MNRVYTTREVTTETKPPTPTDPDPTPNDVRLPSAVPAAASQPLLSALPTAAIAAPLADVPVQEAPSASAIAGAERVEPMKDPPNGKHRSPSRGWQVVQALAALFSAVAAAFSANASWSAAENARQAREANLQFQEWTKASAEQQRAAQAHREGTDVPLEIRLESTNAPSSLAIRNISSVPAIDVRIQVSVSYFSAEQNRFIGSSVPALSSSVGVDRIAPYSTVVVPLDLHLELGWFDNCVARGCRLVIVAHVIGRHPATGVLSTNDEVFAIFKERRLESSWWGSHMVGDGQLAFEKEWLPLIGGLPAVWEAINYDNSGDFGDHPGPFHGYGIDRAARLFAAGRDGGIQ